MTRLTIALAAVAPTLAGAALALPGDAAAAAPTHRAGRPAAHVASYAASSHAPQAKRTACASRVRGHASRRAGCRATAGRVKGRGAQPRRRLAPQRSSRRRAAVNDSAALQAATIAQVLATPCQNTGLTPTPANLALVRAAVLCLINTERAKHDEEPLQPNAHLEAAAESHGTEMLRLNYFDHISPSGVTPVDRVRETGYIPSSEVGYVVGENLAWGTLSLSTPEAIVNAWIASPEHLANILEANYQDTGIDVEPEVPRSLAEGVEGGLYTQEFGTITR